MIPPLSTDILIRSDSSFLLAGQVREPFHLFIETCESEYAQYLSSGDLIAVSAPDGGELRQALILLELIRRWHVPVLVLPPDHPGSARLRMVVSAGDCITLNCSIRRGTHPEQTVICSSAALAGVKIEGTGEGILISGVPESAEVFQVTNEGEIRIRH